MSGVEVEFAGIGLGTWALGGPGWRAGWGPQDDQDSIKTIWTAIDSGVKWIDTAAVYGLGHSESVVGKALSGYSARPAVATKFGMVWDSSGRIRGDLSAESIRRECESSLRRLDVDAIDLYQVHWPEPEDQLDEAWETLSRLQESGKVRYGGVSNFSGMQINSCREHSEVFSAQAPYSLLQRGIEADLIPYLRTVDVRLLCYSPLGQGMLSGKVDSEWKRALPTEDHRHRRELFADERIIKVRTGIEYLQKLGRHHQATPAQLSLAWVLHQPNVTGVVAGARTPAQAIENAMSADIALTELELEAVQEAFADSRVT